MDTWLHSSRRRMGSEIICEVIIFMVRLLSSFRPDLPDLSDFSIEI